MGDHINIVKNSKTIVDILIVASNINNKKKNKE